MTVFRLLSVRVGLAMIIFMMLSIHQGQAQFASASVLREGNWFKLGVLSAGLYKIDATLLRQAGFDPATLNPQNLQLYGNGGGMLPQRNDAPRPDDLVQNAIFVEGAQDGRFDEQDYLLFYAQGTDVWRYEASSATFAHEKNLYSDTTFYFLTVGTSPGLRVGSQPDLLEPAPVVETFPDFFAYERDLVNVIRSGREWYGEAFGFQNEYSFNFTAEGLVPNTELILTSKVMARSSQTSAFEVLVNGQLLGQLSIAPVTNQTYDFKGRDAEARFVFSANPLASGGQIALTLRFQDGGNNGNGYLNFLRFNFTRQLRLYGNQTVFRNHPAQLQARTRFLLSQTPANVRIWDISQAWTPLAQDFSILNNQAAFTAATETPKTFVVFQGSDFPRPLALGRVANQNLHALNTPNLLIITPPFLLTEAERLANLRRQHDGLSVAVVTLPQVYHEFASGQADLTAIRDFVRMLYERAPHTLRYLLLFGDASYDYKDRTPNNFNLIPIYESRQSLHPIFSFSSDDYFGFMEAQEGEWNETSAGDHTLEIGVGRLPVRHLAEARAVVDKLIRYATAPEALGTWRNRVVFLADDGDNNIHQRDADQLAEILEANHPDVENENFILMPLSKRFAQ
ncbi:MAG: type IX secretion system sortase PorU, partial [Microscillaceae bacterium]|nr:type IX secretion system sortase PorU [Microscillaceae bacterium]